MLINIGPWKENIDLSFRFFRRKFRNYILRFQWTNLRKNVFSEKLKFFNQSFSDNERKCFEFLARLFMQCCQNCVSRAISRGKLFFREKIDFLSFRKKMKILWPFLATFSLRFWKLYARFQENLLGRNFFLTFFFKGVGCWSKRFAIQPEKNLWQVTGLSKLPYTCRGEQFERKFFFGKTMFSDLHQTLGGNCSTFLKKFWNRDVKTAIYVSRRSFWEFFVKKTVFSIVSGPWAKKFGFLTKKLQLKFKISLCVYEEVIWGRVFS